MGTTLATAHVFNKPADCVQSYANGLSILEISDHWTSILDIDMEQAEITARSVSKKLDAPVLSFLCFDDDLIRLKMYVSGKLAAQFMMVNGTDPYVKHCEAFVTCLGWDKTLAMHLRKILKCADIERMTALLEEFYGVALYISRDFLVNGTKDFIRLRSDERYKIYEQDRKHQSKLHNKMKVTLLHQMDAKVGSVKGYPLLLAYRDGVNYDGSRCRLYCLKDDEFISLFDDFYVPASTDIWQYSFGYLLHYQCGVINETSEIKGCLYISRDGKTSVFRLPEEPLKIALVFEDGDILGHTYWHTDAPYNYLLRINSDGEVLWRLRIDERIITAPFLYNNEIYLSTTGDTSVKEATFFHIGVNGQVLSSKTMMNFKLHVFFSAEDRFYCLGSDYSGQSSNDIFVEMDASFSVLNQLNIPEEVSIYSNGVMNAVQNRIYFNAQNKYLAYIDLRAMQIVSARMDNWIALETVSAEGLLYGVVVTPAMSTLCVLDANLRLISRHNLKATISMIRETQTGMHVVACTGNSEMWRYAEESCVRLYRVEPV